MRKNLQTEFNTRQYMISEDFEIYYYNDKNLSKLESHTHDYYEFYFFIDGNVSLVIENQKYKLKTGDIILIPPNIYHYPLIDTKDCPYRRFVFWISKSYYDKLLNISLDYVYIINYVLENKDYILHTNTISFNEIQSKVFKLIEEIHSERFGRDEGIELCVKNLILHLNRLVYEKNNPKTPKEEYTLYENIIYYIDEHLEDNLSLIELSTEFHVSKYHIAHVFKNNIGISIHQYIIKKRLEACKNAILNNSKMSEIYLSFGFKDYSNFYRAFKKEYGISPLKFKNVQHDLLKNKN